MKRVFCLLLLLAVAVHAVDSNFLIEKVDVSIGDIRSDGSAHVQEDIRFVMYGDYANALYDSGISNNDLAFWLNITGLKDVKFHVSTEKVDIRDFRLRPQPRTKCNPIQGICHGELILDYLAYPSFKDNKTVEAIPGTGLFTIEQYKPRTKKYTLNPSALSFTTTPEGNTILEDVVFLHITPPPESTILELNPQPTGDNSGSDAQNAQVLSWSDIVLVKFSLVFETEESIEKEVTDFFSNIGRGGYDIISSPYGFAIVAMIIIIIASYTYITFAKRRGEE